MVEEKKVDVAEAVEEVLENVGEAAEEVVEEVAGTVEKSLEVLKETPENKKAVAKSEGKKVEKKKEDSKKSKSAVEKIGSKESKKKVVKSDDDIAEREYVVPLRRGFLNVPQYRRAKKAVRILKEFMVRHMAVRDRDLRKVKVDINLNNEIWFRGIKKPLAKVKVKAVKKDGVVYVTLSEPSDFVKFKIARDEKVLKAAKAHAEKPKATKKEKVDDDKDKDGVSDAKEVREDAASEALKDQKVAKEAARDMKHSTKGAHEKKVMPREKKLSK